MAGLSYVTLYPVDTSFKDRGVRSIPKEISTASSLHKLRWSMYYSTHPVKPKKGATDVSVTPTEAHKVNTQPLRLNRCMSILFEFFTLSAVYIVLFCAAWICGYIQASKCTCVLLDERVQTIGGGEPLP
jgi:hypothetical protein